MNDLRENELAKAKLHWGIFLPAIFAVVVPVLLSVPLLFVVHAIVNVLRQPGMPESSNLNLFWLIPLCPFVLLWMVLLLLTWLSYAKSEVILTARQLIFRTGFLSKTSGDLPLENVESTFISESLFGRILGYGTIALTTIGGNSFSLWYIGSPQTFRSTLESAVFEAKSRVHTTRQASYTFAADDDARYKPKG